ncbi:BON domain-containing protein [Stieleria sp. TO1_6]|uniref:BON domain-containing protein n=1 Tax=Stieleria tagensis TaxID=2956795 RepID=UPI00209ADAE8|nr:BON domain-containing protein [Stieleria tagensis]MCO8121710.1 BON domain-containing protein [Stieleria tagensis]
MNSLFSNTVARNRLLCLAAIACLCMMPTASPADETEAYQPPDQAIELDIQDELKSSFGWMSPDIRARVIAGRVTLRGEVPSFQKRMRAEQATKNVAGVRHVTNRLQVERPPLQAARRSTAKRYNQDSPRSTRLIALTPAKQISGTVDLLAGEKLVVKDFRNRSIETTVSRVTEVTLDGLDSEPDRLGHGMLVFVDAQRVGGKWVAETVAAHSTK